MRKRESLKSEGYTGVYVLGVFKMGHLQPVKLILFQNFPTSLPFILGASFSYYCMGRKEQGLNMGKRESLKSECDTGVSVLGAFKLDHLQPLKLILFQN